MIDQAKSKLDDAETALQRLLTTVERGLQSVSYLRDHAENDDLLISMDDTLVSKEERKQHSEAFRALLLEKAEKAYANTVARVVEHLAALEEIL